MWELDYKESREQKNWCFWTVVLEKTLESPMNCKEIQPVHSEGDQPWVFLIKLLWIFMPRSLCGHMYLFSSVQFSHTVVSDSLRPHEPKHARSPCPSPTPRVYPNSCALSRWCHLTISSSVIPFSCPQCFPASGSFQMSQLFASSGQSTGVSASTSVLPMNTQGLISFRMDWLALLVVQATLKSLLQHHSSKASILWKLKVKES